MPQLTNIVLKDGAAANHTYAPQDIQKGVATLVESTGVPLGDKRLTIGLSSTTQGRRKATLKLVIPVVQDATVNGVTRPTIVRTAYANVEFSFDAGSSVAERKDARSLLASALADASIVLATDSLQALY